MKTQKHKYFIILFLICFIPCHVYSGDFDVSITAGKMHYNDEDLEAAPYGKLTIAHTKSPFYLWGSYERPRLSMMGQTFTYLDLVGGGIGFKQRFKKFNLWIDVGWYEPFNDVENTKHIYADHGLADRLHLELLNKYMPICGFHSFDWYSYRIGGNYGGTIGLDFRHDFKKWFIGAATSYRILEMTEWISGEMWDSNDQHKWCMIQQRDFGGIFIGFEFGYKF